MNLKKSLSLFLLLSLSTNGFAVSIAQLMQQGKIPASKDKILNLSGLHIDNLEGLASIPGIGEIEGLGLNNNDLTHIPARAFVACKNLKVLGLKNNKIISIDAQALDELNQLEIIYLENNKLAVLDPKTVSRLPKLKLIAVNKNPLPAKEVRKLRKALPNTTITRGILNKQILTVIGVSIAALTMALLVYFGVKSLEASEERAEKLEKAASESEEKAAKEFEKAVGEEDKKKREKAFRQPHAWWKQAVQQWHEAFLIYGELATKAKSESAPAAEIEKWREKRKMAFVHMREAEAELYKAEATRLEQAASNANKKAMQKQAARQAALQWDKAIAIYDTLRELMKANKEEAERLQSLKSGAEQRKGASSSSFFVEED